jgi:hypothetical protein
MNVNRVIRGPGVCTEESPSAKLTGVLVTSVKQVAMEEGIT